MADLYRTYRPLELRYFSIEKGKPMFAYTKDDEVIAQLHGNGPWGLTYLDAADGTAKKK